jgi:hypothetical protein
MSYTLAIYNLEYVYLYVYLRTKANWKLIVFLDRLQLLICWFIKTLSHYSGNYIPRFHLKIISGIHRRIYSLMYD